MKLVGTLTLATMGAALAAFALAQGCSGSTSSGNGGGDGGSQSGITPPGRPMAGATTSTTPQNFALHVLQLGDADRTGSASPSAWKAYGYNLDGKITTATSTDVCTLSQGAPKSTQVDGNGGIDNSFGENILPIVLTTAGQDAATKINQGIDKGSFTIMLDITGLTSDSTQSNTGLKGQLFAGGKFSDTASPTWTTADNWPVRPELLKDMTTVAGGSTIQFSDAYVVNGTWVNGSPGDVVLSLAISGQTLSLTIHQAIITFDHTAASKATNGTIAGIIGTEELVNGLKAVAGRISTSLCQGSAFDSIAQQIRQASDIIHDGTNVAGVPCDGISIGLGFTSDQIGEPTTVAPVGCVSADPCNPDAGSTCDSGAPPVDSGADTGADTGDDGGGNDGGNDGATE